MCLFSGDTVWKRTLIPNVVIVGHPVVIKLLGREEQLAYYQLDGGVTAYHGDDG